MSGKGPIWVVDLSQRGSDINVDKSPSNTIPRTRLRSIRQMVSCHIDLHGTTKIVLFGWLKNTHRPDLPRVRVSVNLTITGIKRSPKTKGCHVFCLNTSIFFTPVGKNFLIKNVKPRFGF